ncbi:MAG: HTH-type transcriptional regulator AlsR, partial [Solirubrobacterales bacterium]|nr:HTH-type transcriptional regulator AlsR [Solirubrobacterales bacterium]
MEPEARLLRYFLAVAAELNFTRAAETLGIAQPALSAQIRQLEAQLGVQLLERTTRSVALTDAGRVVQERGPAALGALAEVWDAARRAGRGEAGRLRVAYSPSAGYETAPTLVSAVRGRYPGIEVTAEVLPT